MAGDKASHWLRAFTKARRKACSTSTEWRRKAIEVVHYMVYECKEFSRLPLSLRHVWMKVLPVLGRLVILVSSHIQATRAAK